MLDITVSDLIEAIMFKEVTVNEVIEAIKKNGYEWGGHNSKRSRGYGAYCVLEQAALNLGLTARHWSRLAHALGELGSEQNQSFGVAIFYYNDYSAKSYDDAAKYSEKLLRKHGDKTITIITYG
jgi:hypothetical protein